MSETFLAERTIFSGEPYLYVNAFVNDSEHQLTVHDIRVLNSIGKRKMPCVVFHGQPICKVIYNLKEVMLL